nr:hypothetical protein [Tanacetum cinerariifolium]
DQRPFPLYPHPVWISPPSEYQLPKTSTRRKIGASNSSPTPLTPIATPTPITTVVAAPRLTAAAKGKQPARATSPTDPSEVERTEAEQLKIVLRRSRQETHISQQGGSNTDEGTGSKQGFRMYHLMTQKKKFHGTLSMMKMLMIKLRAKMTIKVKRLMKVMLMMTTKMRLKRIMLTMMMRKRYPRLMNKRLQRVVRVMMKKLKVIGRVRKKKQGKRQRRVLIQFLELRKTVRMMAMVRRIKGRGLQVSQDIEDSHVTLTPVHSDGQRESSSTSSFVTSLLNPIINLGMESIFTTASSSVAPLPSPTSTTTPSIITTTTTASQPPIPPTPIPSEVLQNLTTFESVFRFEDRVKSLEVNFSEFMRTNQSPEAVSNILGIVHQYMHQEMTEAV